MENNKTYYTDDDVYDFDDTISEMEVKVPIQTGKTTNQYVIVGDTKRYGECLVYVCGTSFERAKEILHRMLNNPTDNDKALIHDHYNLRIDEVPEEDCWWDRIRD